MHQSSLNLDRSLAMLMAQTDSFQSNLKYSFALADQGKVLFRRNKQNGPWQVLTKPYPATQFIKMRIDENLLILLTSSGRVMRIKNTLNDDPQNFAWYKTFGFPFGHGPGLKLNLQNVKEIAVSNTNSKTTQYYEDISGNKHNWHISHIYTLHKGDPFVHHFDPWITAEYKFPLPETEHNYISPSTKGLPGYQVGLAAAASVVGVISSLGIYTIEYDFDINGANILKKSIPYNQKKYTDIGKTFFNKRTPISLPAPGWKKQPAIPGLHTGNLILKPTYTPEGKIILGSSTRTLRVIGLQTIANTVQAGYWEKELNATVWQFCSDPTFDPAQVAQYIINTDPPELIPILETSYIQNKQGSAWSLEDFGPYKNLWADHEAKLKVRFPNDQIYNLKLFTQLQFRLKNKKSSSTSDYFSGFIVLPKTFKNDNSETAQQLRSLLKCQPSDSFIWVFIRISQNTVLIRRNNSIFRKIDLFNGLNEKLGTTLFSGKKH